MLQCLDDWRAQCSAAQLDAFDHELMPQCATMVSALTLKNRFQGNIHRALINGKVMRQAIISGEKTHREAIWQHGPDLGEELVCLLADHGGYIAINKITANFHTSIIILLKRGVLFEHDGHYGMPAEMVVELCSIKSLSSWNLEISNALAPMLTQLVPADVQAQMHGAKPMRIQLAAWLIVHGQLARSGDFADQLNESDESLLLSLQRHDLDDFEALKQRYPDMPCVEVDTRYYSNAKTKFSLRKSLEQHIPEQLRKLCRLGLICIITRNGYDNMANISLCKEAKSAIKPYWAPIRKRITERLQQHWQAEPCEADYPAAWSMDHHIWRLWIVLHFMPLGITQQNNMRKNDLKKIIAVLKGDNTKEDNTERIEFLIDCMLEGELFTKDSNSVQPLPINWVKWRKISCSTIIETIRGWESWNKQDEKQALTLLTKLPVESWLKLDDVKEWLRAQSNEKVISANWHQLFTDSANIILHHLNTGQRSIYLLPAFRAVLKQEPVSFAAPGWHGSDKKATVHGFISAAGEIQLPPDCNHSILSKLAGFCAVTSVEQMITLQLDQKALQRLGADKVSLKKIRTILESLQSPLPQAVVYLFEKQQSQKPIANVAATSMVIVLNEASAIYKLRKTGVEFFQPFKKNPEIVLLDASADAHAWIHACAKEGIILNTLIKPVQWISGTASIKAWMEDDEDREDHWLEICYQKTCSSKPKQMIARIEDDYYGMIYIQGTRKTKKGLTLFKSTTRLEPKHVLRLRELDESEEKELGLEQLV